MVYETADELSAAFCVRIFLYRGVKRVFKIIALWYNNLTMRIREAMT